MKCKWKKENYPIYILYKKITLFILLFYLLKYFIVIYNNNILEYEILGQIFYYFNYTLYNLSMRRLYV